jgi:hypothetical protein
MWSHLAIPLSACATSSPTASEAGSSLTTMGELEIPFTAGASSRVATSEARSRSPKTGALPHFPPMCKTAQTRSVPRPSFPSSRSIVSGPSAESAGELNIFPRRQPFPTGLTKWFGPFSVLRCLRIVRAGRRRAQFITLESPCPSRSCHYFRIARHLGTIAKERGC